LYHTLLYTTLSILYLIHLISLTSPPLFSFFFYSYVHHRDLHSFPTRRSSDLKCGLASERSNPVLCTEDWRTRQNPQRPAKAFYPDRKSTRLNSSHVSISYAVFCLKKKNKKRIVSMSEE